MIANKRSLTSILRELHQQLDPEAPRHMPLADRQAAVVPLLGALGSVGEAIQDAVEAATDGSGGEGGNGDSTSSETAKNTGTARRAGTRTGDADRQPQSKAGGASQQRREARGVRIITDAPEPKPAVKPVTRKPVSKPAGESNAVKLWRYLIG